MDNRGSAHELHHLELLVAELGLPSYGVPDDLFGLVDGLQAL
jgi:hypothetical protein